MKLQFWSTFRELLMLHKDVKGIPLKNRFSRNLVNCYVSEWFESNFGLPQRSILSPVLFLVFAGDLSAEPANSDLKLPNCFSKHPPNEFKYADNYNYGEATTT